MFLLFVFFETLGHHKYTCKIARDELSDQENNSLVPCLLQW